jgi:hypothetical protein
MSHSQNPGHPETGTPPLYNSPPRGGGPYICIIYLPIMAPQTGHYPGLTRFRYKGTPGIRITAWECRCRAGAIPHFFGLTSTGVELVRGGLCTGTIPTSLWLSVATKAQRLPVPRRIQTQLTLGPSSPSRGALPDNGIVERKVPSLTRKYAEDGRAFEPAQAPERQTPGDQTMN